MSWTFIATVVSALHESASGPDRRCAAVRQVGSFMVYRVGVRSSRWKRSVTEALRLSTEPRSSPPLTLTGFVLDVRADVSNSQQRKYWLIHGNARKPHC
jgi:hypothetical protein